MSRRAILLALIGDLAWLSAGLYLCQGHPVLAGVVFGGIAFNWAVRLAIPKRPC
jgi:hypothetical protein